MWSTWRALLAALFGLPLDAEQLALFQKFTGRSTSPTQQAKEAWLVIGRRGGKSRIAALVALYLALFGDYSKILAHGERGTLMVIAADRSQAQNVMCYINELLDSVPMLAELVERHTEEVIDLSAAWPRVPP